WVFSPFPLSFQDLLLANGIHTLPKAGVTIRHQLAFARQPLERLLFKVRAVAIDKDKDLRFEYKKGSIDPAFFGLWLLRKFRDLIAVHFQVSKARRRPDRSQRRQLAVGTMESEQVVQVDVGDPLAQS